MFLYRYCNSSIGKKMSTSKIDSIPKWNECMTPRTYKTPRTFRIIFAVFSTIETPRKISTLLSSNLKKKKYVKKFLHHILKRGKKKKTGIKTYNSRCKKNTCAVAGRLLACESTWARASLKPSISTSFMSFPSGSFIKSFTSLRCLFFK